MIVRIPITDKNSVSTEIFLPNKPDDAPSPGIPSGCVRFSLDAAPIASLPAFSFSRYAHPAANINVNVPDGDMSLVSAWFGGAGPGLPSTTLVNRMTSAVTAAIRSYFNAADKASLFTRPFRLGYALRLSNGDITAVSSPILMTPATSSPQMAIREHSLSGNSLQTITEIINSPFILNLSTSDFDLPEELRPKASSFIIFSTRQTDLLNGSETVSGVRSAELFGERVPVWNYGRMAEDVVLEKALKDDDFRIIAEISIEEAFEGLHNMRLPIIGTNLEDWSSFPRFESDVSDSDKPKPDRIEITTEPLDLYRPEEYKKVRGVTIRGIFNRNLDEKGLNFSLFGSQHRENWHLIARARGAHLRYLRGARYRWYKVIIDAPYPALIEAVSFHILNSTF